MRSLNRRSCYGILAGLACLIFLLRYLVFLEYPSRDITTYSAIADGMLRGMRLYADLWDIKPPAIYWTYVVAQQIAGYTNASLLLLSVSASVVTMTGIYVGASRRGHARTGLLAAAAFALVSGDLYLWGNEPNTEIFMNCGLVWAFAIVAGIPERSRKSSHFAAAAAGLLLAAASLYKTVVVIHAFAFGVALLIYSFRRRKFATGVQQVAIMAAASALPWILVFVGYKLNGTFDQFYETVFTYNSHYAAMMGGMTENLMRGWTPNHIFPRAIWCTAPLLIAAVLGAIFGRPRISWRLCLLLCYLGASHVAVALPGLFVAHYYQLLLPPLCIAGAWGVEALAAKLPSPKSWQYSGAALIIPLIAYELPVYMLNAESWTLAKYGKDPIEEHEVGRQVGALLQDDERFYQWGAVTALHWSSKRPPVSSYFFVQPFLHGPLKQEATAKLVRDLDRKKPELLVIDERDAPVSTNHPFRKWYAAQYRRFGRAKNRFTLLCRVGGKLDIRLRSKARR